MLFDTHVHLNDKRFRADQEEVIRQAMEAGCSYMLNVSYDQRSILQSISLSRKYSFIYAAVGIHPHYVKDVDDSILGQIEKECRNTKVVAIGEIGLDFYRNLSPRPVQREWFAKQIHLAKKVRLPIIIHNRDSNDASTDIIKSERAGENGGIVHSFSGDKTMLKAVLEEGMHISISGPVTYRNSESLREIVKIAPIDRLLIETDCPYLTPEPFRGRRNEPMHVKFVAEEIARIKSMKYEEVADATTQNALKLFKIQV